METRRSFLVVFLMVISFFFLFSFILSLAQIKGLKNESLALSNLVAKQHQLEKMLYRENETLKSTKQAEKAALRTAKRKTVKARQVSDKGTPGSVSGNQGFLVKGGKLPVR